MRLKTRLQGFVAVVALATSVLQGAFVLPYYWQQTQVDLQQNMQLEAVGLQQNLQQWLQTRATLLEHAAKQLTTTEADAHTFKLLADGVDLDMFYAGYDDGALEWSMVDQPVPDIDPRVRPWYISAQQQSSVAFTDPYQDVNGGMVLSMSKAFNGRYSGVVAADMQVGGLADAIVNSGDSEQQVLLVDAAGKIIAAANDKLLLTAINDHLPSHALQGYDANQPNLVSFDSQSQYLAISEVPATGWQVMVMVPQSSLEEGMLAMLARIIGITLLVVVTVTLLTGLLLHRLLRPVDTLREAIDELAQGDGDLTRRVDIVRKDEVGQVATHLNHFVEQLHGIVVNVRNHGEQLLQQSAGTAEQAQQQANAVQRQYQQLEQITAGVTQLSQSANQVASQASATNQAVTTATSACEQGRAVIHRSAEISAQLSQQVTGSAEVIGQMESHAQQIDKVLETIETIAQQTNLLALNAAIEAARAGESGRGFAVVADEVRVLSQRTSASTDEIRAMIESLQTTSREAVTAMDTGKQLAQSSAAEAEQAEQSLLIIVNEINAISGKIAEIASAAEQQNQVSTDMAQRCGELRHDSSELTSVGRQLQSSSESMQQSCQQLQQQLIKFRV